MKLTVAQEDYLKAIWKQGHNRRKVNIKRIADELQVASPTVISMFNFLSRAELLQYNKTDGARLTERGEHMARKLIRKHRLIETFLEDVLGLSGPILHREAEKLEHVISDQLMDHIDAHLGFPRTDPHGEEIPALHHPLTKYTLAELENGQRFEVYRIELSSGEKKYCKKYGFKEGSHWNLSEKDPTGSVFLLSDGSHYLALSAGQAERIRVILQTRSEMDRA